MKLEFTPVMGKVLGKSGKEYFFSVYNIEDKIEPHASGVYIFTKRLPDSRTPQNLLCHIFLSFHSIRVNNLEIMEDAKEKGIPYFYYYSSMSEPERQDIIADIKGSKDYEYQLANFPEVGKAE